MTSTKPKSITLNGEKIDLFYINELATAIGREPQTIRKWEVSGVLPKTAFKDKYGRRMYTREQINVVVEYAERYGITQGRSIANTSFKARIHKAFEDLNKKYFGETQQENND